VRSDNAAEPESARGMAMEGLEARMDVQSYAAPVAFIQENINDHKEVEMRTDFPETWLWQMEEIE
jgi:hypothetical protein